MPSRQKLGVTLVLSAGALTGLLLSQACATPPARGTLAQVKSSEPAPVPQLTAERKQQVESQLREIAKSFKTYARVSDDSVGWAPQMCMGPPPSRVGLTRAPEASAHGRKLYFLYARDQRAYLDMSYADSSCAPRTTPFTNPVGQVVVKEAFTPRPADDQRAEYERLRASANRPFSETPEAKAYALFAEDRAGKLFHADELAGLFVMLKLDPATAGTDQGWVYATIDKDLSTITSLGVVESCMNCHKQTDRDRLYGKENSWPAQWPNAAPKHESPATPAPR